MTQHLPIYIVLLSLLHVQASVFSSSSKGARVVLPSRADSLGHVVSNDLSFKDDLTSTDSRHKRHSSPPSSSSSQEESLLYVVIHDAEEEILLQLKPNTKLVSPMTVVEWFYEGGKHVVRRMKENCFYSGRDVRAKGHSLVAVSNCDGLVGYIQTNNESYFIEPLTAELKSKLMTPDLDVTSGEGGLRQEHRASQFERLKRLQEMVSGGPRPHVIYKVKSVLDKLDLSVDQAFQTPPKSPPKASTKAPQKGLHSTREAKDIFKGKPRFKRFLDESKFLKGGRRSYSWKSDLEVDSNAANSASSANSASVNDSEEEDYNSHVYKRSNKGGKRHKRNGCKKKMSKNSSGSNVSNEEKEEKCLTRREKRERKREMKEKRRMERERRKREKEEKRRQRARKKKSKKKRRKNHKFEPEAHSTLLDPLEHEEWEGYSPDLLWETQVAPGQSGLTEFDYGGPPLNGTDAQKWLELTVGVDYTVIDFHGEDDVEKYVFTLFNIVSAIYEDPSLQANLDIVLLRLIFYKDKSQSKVKKGLAKRSLESVNRWAETLHRLSSPHLKHDLAVWLTRFDLGGPSGYAPVAGVCDSTRSCTLNRDEGLTSAFIIAHEMGHVLGLSHDGDTSADNTCEPEGRLGSVMAPLVAATFGRFHWSSCSRREYHDRARSWTCLANEPQWENATLVSSTIQFQYSLDDQCRMEFGQGFGLCRTFGMSDPCTFLWCSNSSTPHLCKTKKGPPLEGTICGDQMWCRQGFCEPMRHLVSSDPEQPEDGAKQGPPIRHNPQHGGWSLWSGWGSCSRTCGTGIRFRSRTCDNPAPQWGGRLCQGKREEWKVCATGECPHLGDLRAEQCHLLSRLVKLGKRRSKLTWKPYESKRRRKKCRITCVSPRTNEVYMGKEYLVDGTPCSYDDPHTVCVQGKCVAMGCDSVVASRARMDDCGVCRGNGSLCRKNTFHFTGTPDREYTEVSVIPAGAWKIAVREEPSSTNFLSLRDNSSKLVLNARRRQEPQRDFISEGTMFHYIRKGERESLYSLGPLVRPVTVFIHGNAMQEEVTITTSFLTRENPQDFFIWEIGPLTSCSVSCGGGMERESLSCKDLRSNSKVEESNCEHKTPPYLQSFPCNQFGCEARWITGAWEHCTATCGTQGIQHRLVSCVGVSKGASDDKKHYKRAATELSADTGEVLKLDILHDTALENSDGESKEEGSTVLESTDGEMQAKIANSVSKKDGSGTSELDGVTSEFEYVDPLLCIGEREPQSQRPCNIIPCPFVWVPQGWTECSVSCGMGQQEVVFICSGENEVGSVCGKRPREVRACFVGDCDVKKKEHLCTKDDSAFCQLPTLHRYCKIPKYYQLCCHTCFKVLNN